MSSQREAELIPVGRPLTVKLHTVARGAVEPAETSEERSARSTGCLSTEAMPQPMDPHRRLVHPMYRAGLERPACRAAAATSPVPSTTPTLTARVLTSLEVSLDSLDAADDDETYARMTMSRSQMCRIVPRVRAA